MSDVVNEFFRQHYPADARTAKRYETCVGQAAEKYTGEAKTIFPRMTCNDGFSMSVQGGHWGAYSSPRSDFAPEYYNVEIGFPSEREELIMEYIDGGPETDPTDTVYGYVPVDLVAKVIEKHGGLQR